MEPEDPASEWTPEMRRAQRVHSAIVIYTQMLRLRDWDIRYDPRPPKDEGNSAEADYRLHERVATIRIAPDVEGDNIRVHIAHELAHLVLVEFRDFAFNVIASAGPQNVPVLEHLGDMEERICDTIAHVLTGITYIPSGEKQRDNHAPFCA